MKVLAHDCFKNLRMPERRLARVQKLFLNPFIFVVDYFWAGLGRISFFNKENNTTTR